MPTKGLLERFADGEMVLCAEGYLFEAERRGYLQAGAFVPEVVLENPEIVREMHRDFIHAGSDVVEAFTYYGHREKLRHIKRENVVEALNMDALKIAKDIADEHGLLMAGNICNTAVYDNDPNNPAAVAEATRIFEEEIRWAVKGGADFIVGETFFNGGEALLALETSKRIAPDLPVVITIATTSLGKTIDGQEYEDCCKQLEDAGAAAVGLNCMCRPATMVKLMKRIRAKCKGPLAFLPSPFRTTEEDQMFFLLKLPDGKPAFYDNLDYFHCTKEEIQEFGKACVENGVLYAGLCCGNSPKMFRTLAESVGRKPPASRYTSQIHLHYFWGKNVGEGTKAIRDRGGFQYLNTKSG